MGDDNGYGIIFTLGFVLGIFVMAGIFSLFGPESKRASELKQEAIERNYAEFNSKTGDWQWIEKQQ